MQGQGWACVDAHSGVPVFNTVSRNDVPFKQWTETSPFLNKLNWGAKWAGTLQRRWTKIQAPGETFCNFSVPNSCNTALDSYQARWWTVRRFSTFSFLSEWIQVLSLELQVNYEPNGGKLSLRDLEWNYNVTTGILKHTERMHVFCREIWQLQRVLLKDTLLNQVPTERDSIERYKLL